jgi:gluconolactonase
MRLLPVLLAIFLASCASQPPPEAKKEEVPAAPPTMAAELIASDPTWGNTEGPAIDSKGTLYFCARGKFNGIVAWDQKNGARVYMAVATKQGPGGLWIDGKDNIYVTATGERQILKITPQKKVSVIARDFEAKPELAKGPNDLVIAANGFLYFTDPNGFYGDAPNGTVYSVSPKGKTTLFSDAMTGPNGITVSRDGKTLYVAHNTAKASSKIQKFALNDDGAGGPMAEVASLENCVADGMDVDSEGAIWLTCYSFGTAYRVTPEGKVTNVITTEQKALTNCFFGRGADSGSLYLTSSDMERVTGYVYRAHVPVAGFR